MQPLLTVTPPLPLDVYMRPPRELPFPLRERDCVVWRRARHGLYEGAVTLGIGPGDVVLMPAWHHGSEVEAIVRTGAVPRFYTIGPNIEPDPTELDTLLDGSVRALHLTHFMGLPQATGRWRAWCDERGLLLLEDAAQAWLAGDQEGPVGRHGDVAIFSLYKAFGVPDGGAALVRPASETPQPERPSRGSLGIGGLLRGHALWLLSRSGVASAIGGGYAGRRRTYDAAADFRLDVASGPSRATTTLLPRVADVTAPARRRRHYLRLVEAFGELVPPAFRTAAPGAAPFALPISVEDRPLAVSRLLERGVRPVAIWSIAHPTLRDDQFPGATTWRERLIGLPVHQELRDDHLDQIVEAVLATRAPQTRWSRSDPSAQPTLQRQARSSRVPPSRRRGSS